MLTYKVVENVKNADFWRAVCCELLATCMLIFIGCGSIILHIPGDTINTSSDIVRVALAFGLTVTVLIRTFGPISGCHVNPAVSIALLVVGRISLIRTFSYVAAQLAGAIAGAGLLWLVVPPGKRHSLGLTHLSNGITVHQGLGAEIALSFVLLMVICACTDENRRDYQLNKSTNPLVIGFTVTVLHLMAIPYTGSSLNPARTFGPSLVDMFWTDQWIYWVGPIVGGIAGAVTYRTLLLNEPLPNRHSIPTIEMTDVSGVSQITQRVRQQYQRYGMVSVDVSSVSSQSPNTSQMSLNSSQQQLFVNRKQ